MATGDNADMLTRLKAVLPGGWFSLSSPAYTGTGDFTAEGEGVLTTETGDVLSFGFPVEASTPTPALDGLLTGLGWALALAFSLISYALLQTRIGTSTDIWLDLTSIDYFGADLPRKNNEDDTAFSKRISANLLPPLGTRAAISAALTNLTGNTPIIFEPWNPGDAGAWDTGVFAFDAAGGWGDLNLPAQAFITAFRQIEGGIANVGGWDGASSTPAYAPGGWDAGAIPWITQDQAGTQLQDEAIFAAVAATQVEGVTCWTRIMNPTN